MYDPVDQRGVPASRGVPRLVLVAAIIGLLCIFGIGGATIMLSGFGHSWPWNTTLRTPLNTPR